MALLAVDANRISSEEAPAPSSNSSSAVLAASSKESEDSHRKALEVAADAMKALDEAKQSSKKLQDSIDGLTKAVEGRTSFDDQWDAFKKKFDDLTKLAVAKMKEQISGDTEARRPAEMISEERVAQVLARAKKLVVLTGAGISAESGIPTFRGADGFWTVGSKNYQPQELATWEKWNEMPEELWRWYQYRWGLCLKAAPNPGHKALVAMQDMVRGSFTLVTQNVDGLHLQAGSDRKRLYEIHGRIDEMRCDERMPNACLHGVSLEDPENFAQARATIVKTPVAAKNEKDEKLPHCAKCGVRQRPKILWFDECYNEAFYGRKSVQEATEACDVLLIIGTQLTTGMPSNMVRTASESGATIIKMDTIVDLVDARSAGMLHLNAKSGEALPRIVERMRMLLREPELAPTRTASELKALESEMPAKMATNLKAQSRGLPSRSAPSVSSQLQRGLGTRANVGNATGRQPSSAPSTPPRVATPPADLRPSTPTHVGTPSAKARSVSSGFAAASNKSTHARSRSSGALKSAATAALKDRTIASPASKDIGCSDVGLFVYGTLRPDDDSGASWTKSFCEGLSSQVAFLPGASLYIDGSYPAVCLEHTQCSVRGTFLETTAASEMATKLLEADRIEGYPDLYHRAVVKVQTEAGVERLAYVYHKTGKLNRSKCERIPDGDWLSRKRTNK